MTRPRVDILYFAECPSHEGARALVERVATALRVDPNLRVVEVPDLETATRLRFLGSPTVRVNGRDVEPGAEARDDYGLACRVYRGDLGLSGQPSEQWIRDALAEAAR